MLPYFIAVGHHQYAKRTRMSLQLFDAWSQQCPELMDEVFGKDHHTVRFSSINWTGTRSDMSIEESVMREAKTSGGIGHGALSHEDALGSWFLFIEHTSKVSEDYAGSIYRQTDSTSYKHPDTAIVTKGDWTFQPPTIQHPTFQPPTCKYTPYKIYRYIHDHHLMSLSQDTACIKSPALVFWR